MDELELVKEFRVAEAAQKKATETLERVKSEIRALVHFEEGQATAETRHFKLTRSRRIKMEQPKAHEFYMKHKDLRPFFKLGVSVTDAEKLEGLEHQITFDKPSVKLK